MFISYAFNILIFLTNTILLYKFLHVYQLKDYNNFRYLKFFKNKKSIFIVFTFFFYFFELIFSNLILTTIIYSIIYIFNLFFIKNLIKSSKTPLKLTRKMSRLYIFSVFILILLCLYKDAFCLIVTLTPFIPIIANFLNIYDKIKNKLFINKAKGKLKDYKTQIIAITGSNGKTSVKNILEQMLSTQFKTQTTPHSYNTPLGISLFINNSLQRDTKFLILEYGARHKNDIKKLCKIFGADYGIVTTISPQHLESFKSVENIFIAKNQLPIFLQNKPCVFNLDNIYCKRMYEQKTGSNLGISLFSNTDIRAKNLKIINSQTNFNLVINNKSYTLKTNLLGSHNISNICLATALAKHIGICNKNIIQSIENLQATPHRLKLIKTHINILDDSYNCSPASAKEALLVLKEFSGQKMIATPGIIECGKEKYNINFNLGKQMAFCDFCVIVGNENKQAIFDGLKKEVEEKNLQPQILFAATLDDAKQHFTKLNNGDTLLLLNDLPDDYK